MMYYKRKWGAVALSSIIIAIVLGVFEFFPNVVKTEKNNVVLFSREPGFYEKEFFLEMSAEHGTIYYTLDGSTPNKNSLKYEEPIWIGDASENENVYSMRTDVSTGFDTLAIETMNLEKIPGYQVPDYKIDKATILRAVVYDELGNKGEETTASYFIGYSGKKGYEGMNVLSIVTDPKNLFDHEDGIYVTGKAYDEYKKNYREAGIWIWSEEFFGFWEANYRNGGKQWERKAQCQFFNKNGELELSQTCGIRIHGGISRGYNPKSLNIYARKEYDGNNIFQADLFGNGYYPSAVTLFQGGNNYRSKAKDYLSAEQIKSLNVASMNYVPYVMFLDGEYWGVYWLNEKYDKDYLEHYYKVSSDNVIIVKDGALEEGEEEDEKYYKEMVRFCSESDLTVEENFDKVCDLIDIDSYVDYNAFMIYIGRSGDWPVLNYELWRVKKEESGEYGDGKWRWMIFDLNSPAFHTTLDTVEYVMNNDKMFKNMMTNESFRKMLIQRIEEVTELFEADKMKKNINEYKEFMAENMSVNDKRFFGDESTAVFEAELDSLIYFYQNRKEYLLSVLDRYR